MKKYALHVILATLSGAVALSGWYAAYHLGPRHGRNGYRTLEADVYHPTFFKRYALARAQRAAWVKSAPAIALAYVGRTRVCPDQQIESRAVDEAQAIFIITRACPYSVATVKEYRIDLVQHDGFWEIEWAGMRFKCAVNQSPVGAYVINHNPFQTGRAPRVFALNQGVRWLANSLNPWSLECPPH